jgi:hypothetical protein
LALNRFYKAYQYDKTIALNVPEFTTGFYWLCLEKQAGKRVEKILFVKD